MNTLIKTLPIAAALLASCGNLRETTAVRDDVYDTPDRQALAAAAAVEEAANAARSSAEQQSDEPYYDERESRTARSDYYNMTYNDPYWYNYGRFGFNSWGPGFGMGVNYGWPTSWGGVSIGYSTGFYDPYWSNSWMSGYGLGYSPWYSPYYGWSPYYSYPYSGYYGGYWSPYQGPWGSCYGCYEPTGYGSGVVYGHRPSMTGPSGNTNTATNHVAHRSYRNPAGLIGRDAGTASGRSSAEERRILSPTNDYVRTRPARTEPGTRSRTETGGRERRTPRFDTGGSRDSGGSWDGGSRSGGGSRGGGNSGGGNSDGGSRSGGGGRHR